MVPNGTIYGRWYSDRLVHLHGLCVRKDFLNPQGLLWRDCQIPSSAWIMCEKEFFESQGFFRSPAVAPEGLPNPVICIERIF
ncbi:MAG: hypothetical protein DRH26_01190 [Deltaproteobacteria bacterium]|nr:MAG: hypothetical protein DRH26_01190 [Deltaproteobacteria bacterium]